MAAKVSVFLAVLLLATPGLIPTPVALISTENTPKRGIEKMETPVKARNSGMSTTGAAEEKGYFAGHVFGGPPRIPPCSRAMLC